MTGLRPGARRFRPAPAHAGFTLLEIMVAVAVIAIVLVSVYKMHAQTIALHQLSRFYATAPLLAQQVVAELEILPHDRISDGSGDFGEDFPGYSWQVVVGDVEAKMLGTVSQRLKQIDVTVSSSDAGSSFSLRTYRFLPG